MINSSADTKYQRLRTEVKAFQDAVTNQEVRA